ncbi:S-adenosyl-L-methionine-dependent methyltransferase [Leucosporidium creatinivorum]|uniref:S-adenosyl-L-methionine-dependent methyltransferase n=1 Tax=Leucosporidium creatinivorum TaxID=106004 RepID=A0A1Y2DJH7_9BASI|nr:S-adenosyl-L-methionine-dependent methyltransferase [Leucosporidium creatinivorum]
MSTYSDPTFTSYNATDATDYAEGRDSAYPPALYHEILAFSGASTPSSTQPTTLLDVGCGPGNSTKDLAPYFSKAVGIDPSPAMIAEAKTKGYKTRTGESVEFVVSGAEDCDAVEGLQEGSVDVLTSAMAAHWFDMPRFWKAAARVLKPGGVVALWTCASLYAHPSTPNATDVQRVLFKLERETLDPYELPGNRLSRDMYANLTLPWDVDHSLPFSPSSSSYMRKRWDKDGIPSAPNGEFLGGSEETTVTELQKGLGTASMVTRWREDPQNKNKEDVVVSAMRELREALGEGVEQFKVGGGTVLLLLRKEL